MSAEPNVDATRPQRPPALHHLLALPLLLLVALGGLQVWMDRERANDRALLDLVAVQDQFARAASEAAIRAAHGDWPALADVEEQLQAAVSRLDEFEPASAADGVLVDQLRLHWRALRAAATELHGVRERRQRADEEALRVDALGAALLLRGDELLAVMADADEMPARIRAAGRQLVLAQRMAEAARQALRGEGDVLVMADRMGRDAVLFGEVNNALVNGDPRLGLARVDSDAAHDIVLAIGEIYREFANLIERVMQDAVALYEQRNAGTGAQLATRRLLDALHQAGATRARLAAERAPALVLRDLLAALTLVAMLGVALSLLGDRRRRAAQQLQLLGALQQSEEQRLTAGTQAEALATARRESAAAMQRTLEAVRNGDLGARCELDVACWREVGAEALAAERETMAALDRTLQAMAERLTETRRTSRDVVRAIDAAHEGARQTIEIGHEQAGSLADARPSLAAERAGADEQAAAAARIARDARERAGQSRAAAEASAQAHERGRSAHEQLGVAVRLASHLNERGRELRELVRLLDDLADEGRILALNAAIHASLARSGEQGSDALSQAVQRIADGVAQVERRGGALADALERNGEECVDALRRAVSGVGGSVQLAAVAAERAAETATDIQKLAELGGALAAGGAELADTGTRRQASLQRVEQLSAVLQQAAGDSGEQLERARQLVALLSAHLAALRLPSHEDANVVDLRDFIKRS